LRIHRGHHYHSSSHTRVHQHAPYLSAEELPKPGAPAKRALPRILRAASVHVHAVSRAVAQMLVEPYKYITRLEFLSADLLAHLVSWQRGKRGRQRGKQGRSTHCVASRSNGFWVLGSAIRTAVLLGMIISEARRPIGPSPKSPNFSLFIFNALNV
jgi:hypothetical protein